MSQAGGNCLQGGTRNLLGIASGRLERTVLVTHAMATIEQDPPASPHTFRAKGVGGTSLVIEVPSELAHLVSRIEVTVVDTEMSARMRAAAAPLPRRPRRSRWSALVAVLGTLVALLLVVAGAAVFAVEPSRLPVPVQEPARVVRGIATESLASIHLTIAALPRPPLPF